MVKDPKSYTEYCLDCAQKHVGIVSVNLGEIAERGRDNPKDPKINQKIRKVMAQLADAAEHLNISEANSPEELTKVNELATQLRTARDIIRNYKKSGDTSLFAKARVQVQQIDDGIENAIQTFGCGECVQSEVKVQQLKTELLEQLESPPQPIPPEIDAPIPDMDPSSELESDSDSDDLEPSLLDPPNPEGMLTQTNELMTKANKLLAPIQPLITEQPGELGVVTEIKNAVIKMPKMFVEDLLLVGFGIPKPKSK